MNLRKYIAGIFYNIWYKIEYGTRRQELSLISELLDNLNKEWELNNYRITLCYDIYNYANGPIIRINNITSIDNNSMSGIYTYQGSDKLSRIKNVCLSSKSNLIYILFCASDGIGHADRLISLQLPANTLISENSLLEEKIIISKDNMKFTYNNSTWRINELQSISESDDIIFLNCLSEPLAPYSPNTTFKYYLKDRTYELLLPVSSKGG